MTAGLLGPELRWRHDASAGPRLRRSGAAGTGGAAGDVVRWLRERAEAGGFDVRRIPFAELDGWGFREGTGALAHRSGRFFSVEGLHVVSEAGPVAEWYQPVIDQPEVGILGILAKEIDGVLHFLMQAKMEPGNPGRVQLSPTVQATRSNYTRAHGGRPVRHIEHFTRPGARVLADVLQSEHGSWFLHKSNRNMIVEVGPDVEVPPHEDFRWVTLGTLGELLRMDGVVNMDARTVLACAPVEEYGPRALHADAELLSWFTGERSRHRVRARKVPLSPLPGWVREDDRVRHESGCFFDVVAVSVRAGTREVAGWSQPLVAPRGVGVAAFLVRRIGGVPHVLVQARAEGGFLDTVELGPTVQCTPGNYAHLPARARPRFLEAVLAAPPERVRYRAILSEEGGRFLDARICYTVVEADGDEAPLAAPPGYRWATPAQLTWLVRHGRYLNVQARTLLACLTTGAVRL
ncbi:NDP-hexose 2,3-dehydratase family protein [Nocardiopsis sp. RSe5-2]|uniref:NDP-hexose 2,3-dehydratase family protein n=1 Tax=Nocardiopsis endophytica TaxID=3018445 RepID=A0ABT4U8I1_9ACTN|nr:NDP-hexose 2,3-dehydratase family protein [Nocardiopsis endophytica]MDA2813256.1 NDP-hexose 2,3-dehydratase family protein [Nocardiopsis endophytica]